LEIIPELIINHQGQKKPPHLLEAAQQGTQGIALRGTVRLLLPELPEEPALDWCFSYEKMVVLLLDMIVLRQKMVVLLQKNMVVLTFKHQG
jgi:hypothetical protein